MIILSRSIVDEFRGEAIAAWTWGTGVLSSNDDFNRPKRDEIKGVIPATNGLDKIQ